MSSTLFSAYDLNGITLKNRVVMAPLTRSRAIGNIPNELMAEYYGQRSGAGLIITEGTSPSANGLGYSRIPGCFNQEQANGWKLTTDAVHATGGKIFLQIMHCGRVAHPDNLPAGARVLAPSAVALTDTKMYVDELGDSVAIPLPTPMTQDDVKDAIAEYAECAKFAISAGFDGVEIHAANGYLIDQFLNPISNKRDDQYGGSTENRLRFFRDVAEAVVTAIGKEKVGVRFSPYGVFNELGDFDDLEATFVGAAEMAKQLGLTYVHVVDHEAMGTPPVPESIKQKMQQAFGGTFILSGGYDRDRAESDLQAGKGDLVAFGRPFIANPDLVTRMKEGFMLTEPNPGTFYTPGPEGYTTYETHEEEAQEIL